jgi:tape measure domain-containing protein
VADLGHAVYTLSVDSSQYDSGMARAEVTAQRITSRIGAQLKNLAAGVTTAAVGVTAALTTSVLRTGIRFNQIYKDASIGLETMLGTAKKAKDFLNGLIEFAKKTPFELKALIPISQQLMAVGFKANEVLPTLRALGDATSALGASPYMLSRIVTQFGQMVAKGRVMGEELRVLAETGVPVYQMLADGLGVTTEKLMDEMRKGTVDAKEAIDILTKGMAESYGGMMKEMAKTYTGAKSNLVDAYDQLTGQLTKPIFDIMAKKFVALSTFLGDHSERIKRVAGDIGDLFIPMLRSSSRWVTNLAQSFKPLLDRIAELAAGGRSISDLLPVARELKVLLAGLGAAFASMGLNRIPFVGAFIPAIPTWLAVIGGFVATNDQLMDQLGEVFSNFARAAGPVIEDIATILGGVVSELLTALIPILPQLSDAFIAVLRALRPLIPTLGGLIVKLIDLGARLIEEIVPAFVGVVEFGSRMLDTVIDLTPAIIALGGAFTGLLVLTKVTGALRNFIFFAKAGKGVFDFARGRTGLRGASNLLPFSPWLLPIVGSALMRGGPRMATLGRVMYSRGRPIPGTRGARQAAEAAGGAAFSGAGRLGRFDANMLMFGGLSLWDVIRGQGLRGRAARAGLESLIDDLGIKATVKKMGGVKAAGAALGDDLVKVIAKFKNAAAGSATIGLIGELGEALIGTLRPAAGALDDVAESASAASSPSLWTRFKTVSGNAVKATLLSIAKFVAGWGLATAAVAGLGYAIWRHVQRQRELVEHLRASTEATIAYDRAASRANRNYEGSSKTVDRLRAKVSGLRDDLNELRLSVLQATDVLETQRIGMDRIADIDLGSAVRNFKGNIEQLGARGVNPGVLDAWMRTFRSGEKQIAKTVQALADGALSTAEINKHMAESEVPLKKYADLSGKIAKLEERRAAALKDQDKAMKALLDKYPFLAKRFNDRGEPAGGIDQQERRIFMRQRRWLAAAAGRFNPLTNAALSSQKLTKQFQGLMDITPQFDARQQQLATRVGEVRDITEGVVKQAMGIQKEFGLPTAFINALAGYKDAKSGQDLADHLVDIYKSAKNLGQLSADDIPQWMLKGLTGLQDVERYEAFTEALIGLGDAAKYLNTTKFDTTMKMLQGRLRAVEAGESENAGLLLQVARDLGPTLARVLKRTGGQGITAEQVKTMQDALDLFQRGSGQGRAAGRTILESAAEGLLGSAGVAKEKVNKVVGDIMDVVRRRDFESLGGKKLNELARGIHKQRNVPIETIKRVIRGMQDVSVTELDRWGAKMRKIGGRSLFGALPERGSVAMKQLKQLGGVNGKNTADGFIKGIGDLGAAIVDVLGNAQKKGRGKAQEVGNVVGDTVHKAYKTKLEQSNWMAPLARQLDSLKNVDATVAVKFRGVAHGDGIGFSGMLGAGKGSAGRIAQLAIAAVGGPQTITSGFRPGAITASGNRSFHADATNPAQDIGGSNLQAVFNWIARNFGGKVRELIYGNTMIKHGRVMPWKRNDHWDHVHVADTGGTIKGPAWIRQGPITESHIPHNRHGSRMLADMLIDANKKTGRKREGRLTIRVENWEEGIVSISESIFDEIDADDRHRDSIKRMNRVV